MIILKGENIGDASVVGTESIVKKILNKVIVGEIPAKVLKENVN